MAMYRVTIIKHGKLPEGTNPFRANIYAMGMSPSVERSWEFEADDEAEVRRLFNEAQDAGIPHVVGFELANITEISP